MMCGYNREDYVLNVVFVCLHITKCRYHHYSDVCEGIEDKKSLVKSLRQLSSAKLETVHLQITHLSVDGKDICTTSHYHHQIGNINQ